MRVRPLPCNIMDIDLRLIFQKMIRIFHFFVVVVVIIQQDKGLVLLTVCLQRGRRRMNRGMRWDYSYYEQPVGFRGSCVCFIP